MTMMRFPAPGVAGLAAGLFGGVDGAGGEGLVAGVGRAVSGVSLLGAGLLTGGRGTEAASPAGAPRVARSLAAKAASVAVRATAAVIRMAATTLEGRSRLEPPRALPLIRRARLAPPPFDRLLSRFSAATSADYSKTPAKA
jgi:hypothetical protein